MRYVVRYGDTLNSIAFRFGIPVEAVMRANGMRYYTRVFPGQVLWIPVRPPYFPPYVPYPYGHHQHGGHYPYGGHHQHGGHYPYGGQNQHGGHYPHGGQNQHGGQFQHGGQYPSQRPPYRKSK